MFLFLVACGFQEFPVYDFSCETVKLEFSNLTGSVCPVPSGSGGTTIGGGGISGGGGTVGSPSVKVKTFFDFRTQNQVIIKFPWDLVRIGSDFYIGNGGMNNIVKLSGLNLRVVAGSSLGIGGNMNGTAARSELRFPIALAVNKGNTAIYVGDKLNNTIKKFDLLNDYVSFVAGGRQGYADGLGAQALFDQFNGFFMVGDKLYVGDSGNSRIRMIETTTSMVSTVAGNGVARAKDGPALTAEFVNPRRLFADNKGVLYIVDQGNGTIRTLENGRVKTLVGSGATGRIRDGIGAAARFHSISAITGDNNGHLYVGDETTLRKINIATREVTTIAGADSSPGVVNGFGNKARFQIIVTGLIYDASRKVLYLLDQATIREISGF